MINLRDSNIIINIKEEEDRKNYNLNFFNLLNNDKLDYNDKMLKINNYIMDKNDDNKIYFYQDFSIDQSPLLYIKPNKRIKNYFKIDNNDSNYKLFNYKN